MTLQQIEEMVLANIRHSRYSALSASTDADDIEDFGFLHRCVWLAREEIKLNTLIPSILKRSSDNATVASQKAYSLPSDFDIPVKVRYRADDSEWDLDQIYPDNLLQKLGDNKTTSTGTPSWYMIFGHSSDVARIELYLIPEDADELFDVEYKPVLAVKSTSTDEDLIMKKYPQTVTKFATAYAFQFIKQDGANFNKFYALGVNDFDMINLRERTNDYKYPQLPDSLTRTRRMSRFSK